MGRPSAGAANAGALIAALEGKSVRQDVTLTGTIEEGGIIRQVGGVFEKAVAAEKENLTLFLLPYGQEKVVYYEQQIQTGGRFGFRFTRVRYTPNEIDLDEYFQGKMDGVEVSSMGEAVSYLIE